MFRKVFSLFVTMAISASGWGAVIHVPDDSVTIQAGISGAQDGDTVLVASGTYTGFGNRAINLLGKRILVLSDSGAEMTTIDLSGTIGAPGFTLSSGEDSLSVIDGFTITGAVDTTYTFGAVVCNGASPTFRNCIITENDCIGFYGYQSSAILENCVISNNSQSGIYSFHGTPLRLRNCVISDNGYTGVSIAWGSSGLEMVNCLVKDNAEQGLAIYTMIENYFVANNTFVGNRIGMEFWFVYPKRTLREPAFDSVAIMNNIFAYNTDRGLETDISFDIAAIVRCNDSYGNPGGNYIHGTLDTNICFGNISLPPLFCNREEGDFHIAEESPCAPPNNSCGVLMGAFEVGCTCCVVRGDVDRDFAVTIGDVTYLVNYFFKGGPPPPCPPEADVDASGVVNVADLTYLVDYLFGGGPSPFPCP